MLPATSPGLRSAGCHAAHQQPLPITPLAQGRTFTLQRQACQWQPHQRRGGLVVMTSSTASAARPADADSHAQPLDTTMEQAAVVLPAPIVAEATELRQRFEEIQQE